MNSLLPIAYADWRALPRPAAGFRETPAPDTTAEILLVAIWQHQRLKRDQLHTLDGRPVRILHPGFRNHEAGPDFHGAVVQLEADPPLTGDIEVDLSPNLWQAHGHHLNPDYRQVVLHVVWNGSSRADSLIPTLALEPCLDAPLDELRRWLNTEAAQSPPRILDGQCCPCLRVLPEPVVQEVLHQAAQTRLEAKAARFHARARQAGWDQALWEGLFRALGYKNNIWPMLSLAELLPRLPRLEPQTPNLILVWQARLLGLAGLLPADLTHKGGDTDRYLRRVWDLWWRERDALGDFLLPRQLWRLANIRPANHPQRRLALAAHWLAQDQFLDHLEHWCTTPMPRAQWGPSLLELLQPTADPFWSRHWTLRASCRRRQPLLGATRVTDLAINVLLPWVWVRARAGKNVVLEGLAAERYFGWPKAEDNALLRLARQRLFGGTPARRFHAAAEQQGSLQIVRDFCDQSNALCAACRFPDLLRPFQTAAPP